VHRGTTETASEQMGTRFVCTYDHFRAVDARFEGKNELLGRGTPFGAQYGQLLLKMPILG